MSTQVRGWRSNQCRGVYDIEQIRRRVSILDLLRQQNANVCGRNRCNCIFCKGSSRGTLAFTADQYCCHRCHSGGDVFTLYQTIHSCSFADALRELAAFAGISAVQANREQLDVVRREQARQAQVALELKRGIRDLRLYYREQVYFCERVIREMRARLNDKQEQNREACASALVMMLDELREAVAAYFLLCFGTVAEQQEFLNNAEWRPVAINGVLARGMVRDDADHVLEVSLP